MSEGFKESTEAIRREMTKKRKLAKDFEEKIKNGPESVQKDNVIACMQLFQEIFLYMESITLMFSMIQERDQALQEMFKLLLDSQHDPSLKRQLEDILKKYNRPLSDL